MFVLNWPLLICGLLFGMASSIAVIVHPEWRVPLMPIQLLVGIYVGRNAIGRL